MYFQHRETQVKRGCSWCNVGGFSNFSEVLAHRLTDLHKEVGNMHVFILAVLHAHVYDLRVHSVSSHLG